MQADVQSRDTSSVIQIPVSRLTLSANNARETQESLDDLLASIPVHGVIQNLVVRPAKKKGHFEVIAGGRRTRACQQLIAEGKLPKTFSVNSVVAADTANALELSFVENHQRLPMHPIDQYQTFAKLVAEGLTPTAIADRFALTKRHVEQRLRLAHVHPEILEAYRANAIGIDALQTYAFCENTDKQLDVWKALSKHQRNNPHAIRPYFTERKVPADNALATFVGKKAYKDAGGTITTDLFSSAVYFDDYALLEKLATAKLEEHTAALATDWGWVEARTSFRPHDGEFRTAQMPTRDATPGETERINKLRDRIDEIYELQDNGDELPEAQDDDLTNELEQLHQAIETIEAGLTTEHTPETKAIVGAIVTLGRDGAIAVHPNLVREDDVAKARSAGLLSNRHGPSEAGAETTTRRKDRPPLAISDALARRLTEARTHALRLEIAQQPRVALIAVIASLASYTLYTCRANPLQIAVDAHATIRTDTPSPGATEFTARIDYWKATVPRKSKDLVPWLAQQSDATLMDLLAVLAASTLNAIMESERFSTARNGRSLTAIDQLATLAEFDMRRYWSVTPENYLTHVSKASAAAALAEAVDQAAAATLKPMKKQAAAAYAAPMLARAQWLPPILRPQGTLAHVTDYELGDDDRDFDIDIAAAADACDQVDEAA
jgi:ParB family chromosome partitioning protein